jgi:D-arabinose 5-phosphate isomerase GutQ
VADEADDASVPDIVRDGLLKAIPHVESARGQLRSLLLGARFCSVAVTGIGGSVPVALCVAEIVGRITDRFCAFVPASDLVHAEVYPDLLVVVSASGRNTSLNRIAERMLLAKKQVVLLSLNHQSEAAAVVALGGGLAICPSEILITEEFVPVVNSIRLLALALSSVGQMEVENELFSFQREVRRRTTRSRSIWQTADRGCAIVYSAALRGCAADIEMRTRETGVFPFHICDQFDLVHGGYVHVQMLIERNVPIFLLSCDRDSKFFEAAREAIGSAEGDVRLIAFPPSGFVPDLQALVWSICDYAEHGATRPKQPPLWGRSLWDAWR